MSYSFGRMSIPDANRIAQEEFDAFVSPGVFHMTDFLRCHNTDTATISIYPDNPRPYIVSGWSLTINLSPLRGIGSCFEREEVIRQAIKRFLLCLPQEVACTSP